jgi:hypothetical protein
MKTAARPRTLKSAQRRSATWARNLRSLLGCGKSRPPGSPIIPLILAALLVAVTALGAVIATPQILYDLAVGD